MFSLENAAQFDLVRGAIAGALVVSVAYLAGYSVFRRSSAAVCAALMVASAAALQFTALGLLKPPSPQVVVVLQGLFAASALIFLSATIRVARKSPILGGLMFAAALSIVGFGLITLFAGGDGTGFMRIAMLGVAVAAVALSGSQALHDPAARLILPGAVIALAAPFSAPLFGDAFAIAPHALLTLGVVGAGIVAITEAGMRRASAAAEEIVESVMAHHHPDHHAERLRVSENQLAQVLDFSGVSIWDWCPHGAHQTEGLATLLGADSQGEFSPETMRAFVHKDDLAKFEKKVVGEGQADGGFDAVLKLHDGRHVRFRGARAVDRSGQLERLVAFIESVADPAKAMRSAAQATFAATPPAAARHQHAHDPAPEPRRARDSAPAFGPVAAAFQPIVSLKDGKTVGFEALARSHGPEGDEIGAEETLRAAAAAGKSGELAEAMLSASAAHLAEHGKGKHAFVAMNVSYSQISAPGFADAVKRTIKEHGLAPKSLVLELTEAEAIAEDAGAANALFKSLRNAGAALAFDDFGAGYTSLGNLQKFSFDYLKIDKSFVEKLASGDGAKIGKSIASLGKELGLTVIAEGVETKEMADAARAAGCMLAQGYAFGAPGEAKARRHESRNGFAGHEKNRRLMSAELR